MANKVVKTRVQNRFDTLTNWEASSATKLLKGEIAVVSVTTTTTDENGNIIQVPAYLMKIGNGTDTFNDLPWLSATAADVYDWAKAEDPSATSISYTDSNNTKQTITLANLFKDVDTAEKNIASLDAALKNALTTITVSQNGDGVVKSITKSSAGGITVSRGTVDKADITEGAIDGSKIQEASVDTWHIADGAVTNDKVAADISATKIIYSGSGSTAVTVAKQLQDVTAALSEVDTDVLSSIKISPETAGTGVVQGITYDGAGTFTATYGTVAAGDIASNAVTEAKIGSNAVTTAKIKDGNVTDAKIASGVSSDKITYKTVTVTKQLDDIGSALTDINNAITGGTHFRGEVSTEPTNIKKILKKDSTTDYIDAIPGDIVLYGEKEFICTAIDTSKTATTAGSATWKELGDLTRVGKLETLTGTLAGSKTANQFVTHITKSGDAYTVHKAQPTASDVSYDSTHATVAAKLVAIDGELANKANSHDHPYLANTTKYAASSSIGGAATSANKVNSSLTIKLNSGTTEGNNLFTFNGSAAKTINVTPAAIGAATSDHTHSGYATDIAEIKSNYVKYNEGSTADNTGTLIAVENGTEYTIIFDCGGASL